MSLTGTPLQAVYDYFLSQVTPDDWMTEEELEALVKALTKLNTWFRSF